MAGAMAGEGLLTIGSFAMLCGFSVPQLRHYDDAGILRPVHVDPQTNYRYYDPSQVRTGRMILALRAVDLPLDEIRDVLESEDERYTREVLSAHRERLARREVLLTEQIKALDGYIEKGVVMTMVTGTRIVGINIPVNDLDVARRFYEDALDCEFAEDQHDQGPTHLNTTFGDWGKDNWFLVALWPEPERAGTSDISFLVEDLDAAYEKALAAGATDLHGPMDKPGMPRNAYVKDPSGNIIGLYQG
jgi:DNA-binding transcriptional MerR regulator